MEEQNYFSKKSSHEGWHKSTELGCDLKTILRNDARMRIGRTYQGMLTCDSDAFVGEFICKDTHFTFIETQPSTNGKHNPRLFNGEYVTLTQKGDGSLHLNFKKMKIDAGFTVDGFALAVCNEIRQALTGLIE